MDTAAPRTQIAAITTDCRTTPIAKAAMPGIAIWAQSKKSRKNKANNSGTVIAVIRKYVSITRPAINPIVGFAAVLNQLAAAPADGAWRLRDA